MSQKWQRIPSHGDAPEHWRAEAEGETICIFFRSEDGKAWQIAGKGPSGANFLIVCFHDLVEDVKTEAEMTLRDFGWMPRGT